MNDRVFKTPIGSRFRRGIVPLLVGICVVTGCGGGGSSVPPPAVLSITSVALSDGTVGASYSDIVEAAGGVGPFAWTLTGSLPHGLTMDAGATNKVTTSGIPDTAQSNVTFTVRVTDTQRQSAAQTFSVDIKNTIVQTQSGALQGVVDEQEVAFRGVPYATPPVGNLRWRPPQPPLRWTGTRDASTFGDACPQSDDSNNQVVGSEDCLFLNIFSASQTPHGVKQPVMVFIHGGSNRQGGGAGGPIFDAPPLAKEGVIVVTIQYRLGMLGFFVNDLLTAEGGGSSGNYGLMDQIAALTWIQQNIAAFGGDPGRVMVFGHSAGSIDIHALLASPMAHGLFSAAGMMSGSIGHGYLMPLAELEPLEEPLVAMLGCDSAPDVLMCLRAAPAADVVNNQNGIPAFSGEFKSRALVLEPHVVPLDPFDVIQQDGTPVPLLIGSTREEASGLTPADDPTADPPLDEAGYEAALHAEFDTFGPNVANQVLSFYPAADYDAPVYALIAVDSDFLEICWDRNTARSAVHNNGPSVWRYLYTHRYENDTTLNRQRAFHGSLIPFVFGRPEFVLGGQQYTPSAAEISFTQQMMHWWSQFAKTNDPNGTEPAWPPYNTATDSLFQLDETSVAAPGYHNTQCDYLMSLIPQDPTAGRYDLSSTHSYSRTAIRPIKRATTSRDAPRWPAICCCACCTIPLPEALTRRSVKPPTYLPRYGVRQEGDASISTGENSSVRREYVVENNPTF